MRNELPSSPLGYARTYARALLRCIERYDLPGLSLFPDHHSSGHRLILDKHRHSLGDLLGLEKNGRDQLLPLFGCHLGAAVSRGRGVYPPGEIQLTRTPICSLRVASEAVRRTTPALAAPYSGLS